MSRDTAELESRGRGLLPGARAQVSIPQCGLIRVGSTWLDPGATLRAEQGQQAGPETLRD